MRAESAHEHDPNYGQSVQEIQWEHSLDLSIAIATRLDELHMTQKELAEKAGLKPSAVSRALNGTHNLTLETIARLEKALKIRFDSGFKYGQTEQASASTSSGVSWMSASPTRL